MGERDHGELVATATNALTESDPEIDRLRAEIEAGRERIRGSIVEFQDEFEETLDWRRWVREHPWETVGVAFAIGFLWGSG